MLMQFSEHSAAKRIAAKNPNRTIGSALKADSAKSGLRSGCPIQMRSFEVQKSILTRGKLLQVFFQDDFPRYSAGAVKHQVVHKTMQGHSDQQSFENPYLIDQ